MKLTTQNTDLEIVVAYIISDNKESFVFSEKQAAILERLDFVRTQMMEEVSSNEILDMLCKNYKIHISTAYLLCKTAYKVYDYRQILIDNTLKELKETKQLAILKENPAAAALADKNRLLFLEKFMGTKDENFYENLQPVDITLGNFPELTGVPQLSERDLKKFIESVRKLKNEQMIINLPNTLNSESQDEEKQ